MSFFMTRCEYLPVRSVAASLRQTVMKNDIPFMSPHYPALSNALLPMFYGIVKILTGQQWFCIYFYFNKIKTPKSGLIMMNKINCFLLFSLLN